MQADTSSRRFGAAQVATITDCIIELSAIFEIERLWLFGSSARASANVNSDVDIVVKSKSPRYPRGAFEEALSALLGVKVDAPSVGRCIAACPDGMLAEIHREMMLLFDGCDCCDAAVARLLQHPGVQLALLDTSASTQQRSRRL